MTEKPKDVSKIGEKLLEVSQANYKQGAVYASENFGKNEADALYLGLMTSLGPMIPASMIAANRDKDRMSDEEFKTKSPEELGRKAAALVKPETIFFVALAAAHLLQSYTYETTQTEFGPSMLGQALNDWRKLFPKSNAEQFLSPAMLRAIDQAEREQFSPELKKKFGVFLPGNGSIN
jgi:hypothetical protein